MFMIGLKVNSVFSTTRVASPVIELIRDTVYKMLLIQATERIPLCRNPT